MFVVIKSSGTQFKVQAGQELDVDFMASAKEGDAFEIKDVIFIGGENTTVNPKNASVKCEVLKHFRGEKLVVFKNRQRSTFRKKTGHRQNFTRIKIKEIVS